jgi:ornithine cyclodeaminase/alanine dehydrogenase
MKDAIHAVEDAFRLFAQGLVRMPPRESIMIDQHRGQMLAMPAYIGGANDTLGQKIVTVYPENRSKGLPTILAVVQLFDPKSGECLSVMDGTYLTAVRTGAVSGVATKYLARRDAESVAVFGAGVQAESQLEAMKEVRGILRARVFDPLAERAFRFGEDMSRKLGIGVEVAQTSKEALRGADIVICASTSSTPVFSGQWLELGMHINAVGSHNPNTRELDTEAVRRSKVIVDSREAALKEAGDLLIPISERAIASDHVWADLGEIVSAQRVGRDSDQEITLFKSVGLAIQDVSTARVVYAKAIELGKGTKIGIHT